MKKLGIFCGLVGLTVILAGCVSTKEVKEVKIIHEHHIYVHNNQVNRIHRMHSNTNPKSSRKGNQKFGNPKGGIDPRYDHKPGHGRPNKKLGNSKNEIDPRYDHKTGSNKPK